METPPTPQTSIDGETVEDAELSEGIRVAQCSIGTIAQQIDEVVAP